MNNKKSFWVTMPIAGSVALEVEADSEEEAIENFYTAYEKTKGLEDRSVEYNWEFYEKMHNGNVAYYEHWEVEVEEALKI